MRREDLRRQEEYFCIMWRMLFFLMFIYQCSAGIRPIKNEIYDLMLENPEIKLSRNDPSKNRLNAYRLLKKFDVKEVKCFIKGTIVLRVVSSFYYLLYIDFFLLEYLFEFEPQVFLEFLDLQPQNILGIFLLDASFQLICLILKRFCIKLKK